ncbi:hypothetical protein LTR15_002607 [Elasticomyces elasticus]|nr:hypothetical protein LTR15_002607 [Elasticomyces elasticus]
MPPKKIYYIYNPDTPHTAEEEFVIQKGYPIVSTTPLGPGGRLFNHRHHSRNTHFITSGSIKISKSPDNELRLRAEEKFPGEWVDVPSGVDYIGVAGEKGCTFVEGHTVLSPTTAERMLARKAIVVDKKKTLGAFTTEEHH